MTIIKSLFVGLTLMLSSVNAAIIDNEADMVGTYKDTDTGLIWMDFGINNNRSYNDVVANLDVNGDYSGWSLPTAEEVYSMWRSVSGFDSGNADKINLDRWGTGQLQGKDVGSIINDASKPNKLDSVFDATFDVIGYNSIDFDKNTESLGLFLRSDSEKLLSYAGFKDAFTGSDGRADEIELNENYDALDYFFNNSQANISTLLVWKDTSVSIPDAKISEPSLLFILSFGLLAMVTRRKKYH